MYKLAGFLIRSFIFCGFVSVALARTAFAQEPATLSDLSGFLARIVDLAYAFGGFIFLIFAIIIGFQWMTSQGADDALEEVRQRLSYWVTGIFLYFLSFAMVFFFFDFLQVRNCTGDRVVPGFNLVFSKPCPQNATHIQINYTNASQTDREICAIGEYSDVQKDNFRKGYPDAVVTFDPYYEVEFTRDPATGNVISYMDGMQQCCDAHTSAENCP